MQAIAVRDRDAGPAGLSLTELPYPEAAENDVIVRVHTAGFIGHLAQLLTQLRVITSGPPPQPPAPSNPDCVEHSPRSLCLRPRRRPPGWGE